MMRWLALDAVSGLGQRKKLALLAAHSLEAIWEGAAQGRLPGLSAAQQRSLIRPDRDSIDAALAWLNARPDHHLLTLSDPRYPPLLKHLPDAPLLLFVAGDPTLLSRPALAMVGSRNASPAGRELAQHWARLLTEQGWLVISGLAEGIDGAAHLGALETGATVSVEGSGLAGVYPRRHQSLAQRIQQQGARVSEFWPGAGVRRSHFPRRNRIVSGLSLGTLVVEASLRSGSLITARLAAEQGREVFAVPGSVLDPNRAGCHYLIQQGAKLVTEPVDILEELLPQLPEPLTAGVIAPSGGDVENLPVPTLLDSVGYEATPVDDVVAHSRMPVDVVLEQLTEMELDGWVAAVPGGYVRLRGKR
ncbi:DNA-processing protein DprA [Ferrimonas balearica]|nr:DNA-processing protein DprA [Ferrimonas balearica]